MPSPLSVDLRERVVAAVAEGASLHRAAARVNVREYPTTGARIVGVIPPDGRGIVPLGDRNGGWVFVRYENVEGWVSSRFLYPEVPPIRRGRRLD